MPVESYGTGVKMPQTLKPFWEFQATRSANMKANMGGNDLSPQGLPGVSGKKRKKENIVVNMNMF